jgi:hypothetical protein
MHDDDDDFDDPPHRRRLARSGLDGARSIEKARKRHRRNATTPKNEGSMPHTAMDDIEKMNELNVPTDKTPIFGVYGADEWITNSFTKKAIENGRNVIVLEGTWLTGAGFKLHEWVMAQAKRYNFMSTGRAFVFFDWGFVEATHTRGKLELEVQGDPEPVLAFLAMLDTQLKRAESLIEWVYGTRGNSIQVPLNYRPAVKGSYPWLNKTLDQYIDDYLNGSASVLILLGPPGTGKTTFIKNLIHRSGGDAKVTYDEKVMNDDSLFAGFIQGDAKFMIMEDADTFLRSRTEGNTMMHRFLNVADGLVSAEGKKLVFSTNLPSVRDIDDALMRPGRCHDVLTFRALTRSEAQVVTDGLGTVLPDGSEFTLAQLFNQEPMSELHVNPIGFVVR